MTKNLLHVLHGRRDVEGALEIIEVRRAQRAQHSFTFSCLTDLSLVSFPWFLEGRSGCGRVVFAATTGAHAGAGPLLTRHKAAPEPDPVGSPSQPTALCNNNNHPATQHHTPLPHPHTPRAQGVYAGGVESASALVRRGEASPRDFMLLSGYSGWGPWQLQQELRGGTWLPVAASQGVIMDCLQGVCMCVCV